MSSEGKRKRAEDAAEGEDAADQDEAERDEAAQQREEDEEDEEIQRRLSARRTAENERLGELYEEFVRVATPEQLERFEHWKRSHFPRAPMKRLMKEVLGTTSDTGAIVLAAVSKMFVGELVESAREQMTAAGETGPIQPSHLRQAHRRAQRAGAIPSTGRHSTCLFWRSDSGA